ncbi:MAG TPA: hypothetical protein VEQ59_14060 [Polyangiaceae bacterium]|nr:hypothetical protein [Polyangiaceae bacterium]
MSSSTARGAWRQGLLVAAALLGTAAPAVAAKQPKRDPPLLFGGAVRKAPPKPPLDPRLPTGTELEPTRARPLVTASLCSFTRPVCVHATSAAARPGLAEALAALERAYEREVLALRLPAPLIDRDRGGSDALDWYLSSAPAELTASQDALLAGHLDAAPVFCESGASRGALLERQAAFCVGEALASSFDAGESPDARHAFALELWWISGVKTSLDVQAVDDAQRHPEDALAFDAQRGGAVGRLALLLEMLETTRSVAAPGVLSASMFSAAAGRTPPSAAYFDNEPDVFDVLRHSLDEDPPVYADLMIDFALRRALAGDRDDGTRLPALMFAGSFARPRFDWVIPFSSLPRRVLSGVPIAQSGAELIWIELDDAPLGATVAFRAEWEPPAAFHWRMLLVDRDGRDVRRIDVPFQERGRSADARVLRLDGAKALILAGVNVGGIDLSYPFDPDLQPLEPAACTVYLVSM